jgi:3-dehydroquinate dehydratase-1
VDLSFDDFVLAAATADLSAEPAARDHADAVEFRMDMARAAGGDPAAALAAYDGDLPLIATDRAPREGGAGDAADGDRLTSLVEAAARDAVEAVDLELALFRGDADGIPESRADEAAAAVRERGASLVVSTHDFEGTPPRGRLLELLEAACRVGDVGKLAVTAADRGDALDLLAATHRADARGDAVATMAMGAAGRHTRAVAPTYGSRIGYAPVDPADATAPGQYDLEALASLVERLR